MTDSINHGSYFIAPDCEQNYEPVMLDREERKKITAHVFKMLTFVKKELKAADKEYKEQRKK